MDIEGKINIVEKISEAEHSGIGLISLANGTGIPQSRLRRFIESNTDYFCRVGEKPKYVINRTGVFKGLRKEIVSDLYAKEIKSKNISFYLCILAAFFVGYTLGNV